MGLARGELLAFGPSLTSGGHCRVREVIRGTGRLSTTRTGGARFKRTKGCVGFASKGNKGTVVNVGRSTVSGSLGFTKCGLLIASRVSVRSRSVCGACRGL